jgi:pyruvate/2-oxoglutarate dehydrogenase complex dihydrolipoamide acyltransferase (E2) component
MAAAPYPQAPPLPQAAIAAEPVELPQRSKKGLLIVLALLGVGLVAGVTALVLVSRGPKSEGATASSGSATPSASTPVAAAPAPSESAPAATATPPASAPEPLASAAAGPEAAELTIVCTPECDSITIDDNALKDNLTEPVQLPAGAHTLTAAKATYVSQTKKVTLKPGQKQRAMFILFKPGPAPAKHCGKFLERCP